MAKAKKAAGQRPAKRGLVQPHKTEVKIPKKPSVPMGSFHDYILFLFGEKKIGKTTLVSQFPNTFHVMTEPGGRALKINQPVDSEGHGTYIRRWLEFKAYPKALAKTGHRPCIDTVDRAYDLCFKYMCKKLAIQHPNELEDFGQTWNAIFNEFMDTMQEFLALGRGVVFISHSKVRPRTKWDNTKIERLESTLSGKVGDSLTALADLWAYYGYEGTDRVLYIRGNEFVDAGCRLEGRFLTTKGKPVSVVPMGNSPAAAYKRLLQGFDNKLKKQGVIPERKEKPARRGRRR